MEWKPCGSTQLTSMPDTDDTEWVIEGDDDKNASAGKAYPRNSPPRGGEKKATKQKYQFSADLGTIRSFVHGNLKKSWHIFRLINVIIFRTNLGAFYLQGWD